MISWLELTAILSRPIAFHRIFAEIGGGAIPGLFLSQAFYWTSRTKDPEGWFYKTQEDWHKETALIRSEQDRARRELKNRSLLEERKQGLPCKLFYRINKAALLDAVSAYQFGNLTKQACKDEKACLQKLPNKPGSTCEQDCDFEQAGLVVSANNLYTETTPETTSETTSKRAGEFENSASPEEEPGTPSQFSLPEQPNQPIDTKNCQVAGDDQAKGVPRCNNSKYQNVQDPDVLDESISSGSKECIAACDNNAALDINGGAYKMEQRLKGHLSATYPIYRTKAGKNGIKPEFLEWLRSSYLPRTDYYRGKKVDLAQAKGWVLNKESAGQQELIEVRYEQMLAQQQPQQLEEPQNTLITPEQEAWIAIAKEIQIASNGAYVDIAPHGEFWQLTSNINGFSGWLHTVMANIPLASLPTRLRTWYPECYCNALKKSPHLNLPAPLSPINRVG